MCPGPLLYGMKDNSVVADTYIGLAVFVHTVLRVTVFIVAVIVFTVVVRVFMVSQTNTPV